MCLEQDQQEHKSRFNDTNPEIQKKKKRKKKAINQNLAKSMTIHLNHPTSTTKQHSTNQTTDHQQTL